MASTALTSMPTAPPETHPQAASSASLDLDIVHTYQNLLSSDPLLTPPIAAIESLISLLSASPPSTTSETLTLLSTSSAQLKASVPNPLALTAGTDLFQRYIITTLQSASSKKGDAGKRDDFKAVRAHLLANSRLFVQRAKEARGDIAERARGFLRDEVTVCTCGGSRVVSTVLTTAAQDGARFRVIHVKAESERPGLVKELRQKGIPVARVPFEGLATAMAQSTFAMVGAESVVENGGVISGLGSYQMGFLAKSLGKPFYVVAESYKFVRVYPLNGQDVYAGGKEGLLTFRTGEDEEREVEGETDGDSRATDFTPPELITALVTESGVHTPSAVSEELIKIWY